MKILKFLPGSIALAFGAAILTAPTASADPYCYSFGLFSTCAEFPSYNTPTPPPPKPLPVWVCRTVAVAQAVTTVIPSSPIVTIISRVIFVPTVVCAMEMSYL